MLRTSTGLILKNVRIKSESFWNAIAAKTIMATFHSAAKRVPAYKDFLKKHKINSEKIKTLNDFKSVPPTDKDNYLRAYPYDKLFWDGNIKKPLTIHSTSGSTGESSYFNREYKYDVQREIIIEHFFRRNNLTIEGPTLFIISFGMGMWSAGMGIYTAAYLSTNRNKFPISIATPGVSKIEVLKILKNLAPHYKQVILAGYPPFVKDVLDEAAIEKINLKKLNLRFVFTGEAFPEEFRDFLSRTVGIKNIYLDTMNTYGTSELGAIGVETPLAILAKRSIYKNNSIFKEMFGNISKTPTIVQYIPYFANFECVDDELFFTGDSPTPLIKYQSGDHGGLFGLRKLQDILLNHRVDLKKQAAKLGIKEYMYNLPFVYVYERKNLTTTLYGILIYPEFIKAALYSKYLNHFLTGKFYMVTNYDNRQNQYLEIHLEMKKGIKLKKHYEKLALKILVEVLQHKSSEYLELSTNMKEKVYPKLHFWEYEHPQYFALSNKHKWVSREKVLV